MFFFIDIIDDALNITGFYSDIIEGVVIGIMVPVIVNKRIF